MNVRGVVPFVALVLSACTRPPEPVEPDAPATVVPSTPAEAPDPEIVALNLDFEQAEGEQPKGWNVGGEGYTAVLDSAAKTGESSLRLTYADGPPNAFGVAASAYPIERAKGQRITLSGFIKTDDVTEGYAGLWLRVDGQGGRMISLDNMGDRGVTGTADWRAVKLVADVPQDALNVAFGAILTGKGVAWFDALSFEQEPMPELPSEVEVAGTVTGPDGTPVAGASVAVLPPRFGEEVAKGLTQGDGSFSFTVPRGSYRISVSAPGLVASSSSSREYRGDDEPSTLSLVAGGVKISGRVRDERGDAVGGAEVWVIPMNDLFGAPIYVQAGPDGGYSFHVSEGLELLIAAESEDTYGSQQGLRSDREQTYDLEVVRRLPAPDAVVADIGKRAVALDGVKAGAPLADMEPLRKMVGKARVVGLGESTHGTREYFQMKHRMLEFLVERMGFTVFAIEASFSHTMTCNDYVLHAKGSAKDCLDAMLFWTWRTEEVRDLIEWMRTYNADPKHKTKLEFIGFDMQAEQPAADVVAAYLKRVDSELSDAKATLEDKPEDIIRRFDEQKKAYVAKSSLERWQFARRHAVVFGQWKAMAKADFQSAYNVRDESMADNIRWILSTRPRGTKVVVWAHNGHVGRELMAFKPMGKHLSEALGADYRIFGFAFGDGGFQAMGGNGEGLRDWEVGPPPPESVDAAFRKAKCTVCVVDLRRLPKKSALRTWLERPRITRDIGAVFTSDEGMQRSLRMRSVYDALIYVDRTTRARPSH